MKLPDFLDGSTGKKSPAIQETRIQLQGQEAPLEEEMATHSSILTWKIPWTVHGIAGYSPWGSKESDMTE